MISACTVESLAWSDPAPFLTLGIQPSVLPRTYSLAIENVRAFSAAGREIEHVRGVDGTVRVSLVPRPCAGDCDFSGDVGVDELITSVSIALGEAPLFMCEALDVGGDGSAAVSTPIAIHPRVREVLNVRLVTTRTAGCPT